MRGGNGSGGFGLGVFVYYGAAVFLPRPCPENGDEAMRILTTLLPLLLLAAAALPALADGPADALWELYRQGRFEEVVLQGKGLINTGNQTAQVDLAVGRALHDLERYEEALLFLGGAVELDPERTWVYAWAQIYLGGCHWQLGDRAQARQALTSARDAAATDNATRNAESSLKTLGLDAFYDDWIPFASDHFVFHFAPQLVIDRAAFVRRREAAFGEIAAWFGGAEGPPIQFFVWVDGGQAAEQGLPQLGFAKPPLGVIHARVEQTVGHEMTHVISYRARRPSAVTGLINEGVCVHFDQTDRDQLGLVRRALKDEAAASGRGAPLPVSVVALWEDWSLLPTEISYPLAGAWVGRLIERGGRERFLDFFADQSLAHARAVYGADLDVWLAEFDRELSS